jgi:hypothetical protein
MGRWRKLVGGGLVGGVLLVRAAVPLGAAMSVDRVSEGNMRDGNPSSLSTSDSNWYREDTRVGGGVTLTKDFAAPGNTVGPAGHPNFGDGSLALTTNSQTTAKAQLFTSHHVTGTPLAAITKLSYYTYQSSTTSPAIADAAYEITVDLGGGGFTTLVYEPYQGGAPGPIVPDTWQYWDATSGNWWSTRQITCGTFSIAPGHGGPPFTNPTQVGLNCPNAKVIQVGVNVGSNNANYTVAVDGLQFQTATDDFTWDFGPK